MAGKTAEGIKQEVLDRYFKKTGASRAHYEKAKAVMPGGDTRSVTFFLPYPLFFKEGRGCRLYDEDGNEYIDFVNNFTSLIHGHAHPKVVQAAQAQAARGTAYGAPSEIQYRHAEHLIGRMPSLELVRYCNSGTEATLFAMRAARAFTDKDAFIKMDGGYHGSHDFVEANLVADLTAEDLPRTNLERAIPKGVAQDLYIAPFNDLKAVERLLQRHQERIAGIILEPLLGAGGLLTPGPGYLEGLRELADRYGVLLVFDEIITFRLSAGGMQALYAVRPDLTALGKIIGGGYPVGAFGGRADIMKLFDPTRPDSLTHSGTFSGNNATLAAGLAALEAYGQDEADRINALGDRMRRGFQTALDRTGLVGQTRGFGSLGGAVFSGRNISHAKDAVLAFLDGGDLSALLHLEMLNRGIFFVARGLFALSTAMTEKEIDWAVETFEAVLQYLKPYVAEKTPALIKV
ncbi:MAG: aspartate aminotransferase family protein [Thermodesulfobacteriota bacterium]